MPDVAAIYKVTSVRIETGRPRHFVVGTIVHFTDGTAKLRLNMFPSEEYILTKKEDEPQRRDEYRERRGPGPEPRFQHPGRDR